MNRETTYLFTTKNKDKQEKRNEEKQKKKISIVDFLLYSDLWRSASFNFLYNQLYDSIRCCYSNPPTFHATVYYVTHLWSCILLFFVDVINGWPLGTTRVSYDLHCRREDERGTEKTSHLSLYAEAKKMKSLTFHAQGSLRTAKG